MNFVINDINNKLFYYRWLCNVNLIPLIFIFLVRVQVSVSNNVVPFFVRVL